jgi:hypothetical protein
MKQFECQYCCSKGICEHLLAAYDVIGREIIGGLLRNSNELKEMITLVFEHLIQIQIDRVEELLSDSLLDLWYDSYDAVEGSIYIHNLDPYLVAQLSELVISEVEDFESGPGTATTYELFYHINPADIMSKLFRLVEIDLNNAKNSNV